MVDNDDDEEEIDEAEMKELMKKHADATLNGIVDSIVPAFEYLENRLAGKCKPVYSLEHTFLIFRLARIFYPSFVSESETSINYAYVGTLASIKPLA